MRREDNSRLSSLLDSISKVFGIWKEQTISADTCMFGYPLKDISDGCGSGQDLAKVSYTK